MTCHDDRIWRRDRESPSGRRAATTAPRAVGRTRRAATSAPARSYRAFARRRASMAPAAVAGARHRPRARDPPGFFARRPRPAPPDVRARPQPAHRPDRTERSRTAHTHGWRLARDPRPFASPDLHMRVYQRASASHVPRVPRGSLRHALDARAPLPRTRATRVAIPAPQSGRQCSSRFQTEILAVGLIQKQVGPAS